MTHLRIDNARVIDPANVFDDHRTLYICDGKLADHCNDDATVIDAKGLIACPGFIDLYARLREPGFSRKGTIATESQAALKGGFTTVFCAPDTQPVIDSNSTVELIKQKAVAANGVRVVPVAALTAGLEGPSHCWQWLCSRSRHYNSSWPAKHSSGCRSGCYCPTH